MGAAFFACCALNVCECFGCCVCSLLMKAFNATLSQVARLGHFLILLSVFVLAIIIGVKSPQQLADMIERSDNSGGSGIKASCDPLYLDTCIYHQLIYRASAATFIFFTFMAICSVFTEYINKSFWILKFIIPIGLFVAFFWGSNGFFSGWAETTRYLSFLWLLIQGLLLLDFAHDCHDVIMLSADQAEEKGESPHFYYGLYLFLSLGFLTAAIVGLVYLFMNYTGCQLGMFFVVLTLIVGVLQTVVSVLNSVNKGLLTPFIIFAYSVFMCWYALLSSSNESCNPGANTDAVRDDAARIIICIISFIIITYCVVQGSKILNIFNPEASSGVIMMPYNSAMKVVVTGEQLPSMAQSQSVTHQPIENPTPNVGGNNDFHKTDGSSADGSGLSSGTTHERVFFHVLLMLVACYNSMILTRWGNTNGALLSESSNTNEASMWLKIVSQWVFLLLYCKVLQVAYTNNQEA